MASRSSLGSEGQASIRRHNSGSFSIPIATSGATAPHSAAPDSGIAFFSGLWASVRVLSPPLLSNPADSRSWDTCRGGPGVCRLPDDAGHFSTCRRTNRIRRHPVYSRPHPPTMAIRMPARSPNPIASATVPPKAANHSTSRGGTVVRNRSNFPLRRIRSRNSGRSWRI